MELGSVFQGLSAAASIVSAFKAAIDVRKELTKQDVLAIAADAQRHSQAIAQQAIAAAQKIKGISDQMAGTIKKKIEDAQAEWQHKIAGGSSQTVWAQATDKYKADCCALLRNVKQLNGGMLPDDWYDLWAELGCP